MEDLGALIVVLVWGGIILIVKSVLKAAKKTVAKTTAGTAPRAAVPEPAPVEEPTPAEVPFRTESAPFAPRTDAYVGSLGVIADGPGSMGGESGEGIDPCHEEQSREMDLLEAEIAPAEDGADVLPEFTAAGIAKAFVMSEILNRKRA